MSEGRDSVEFLITPNENVNIDCTSWDFKRLTGILNGVGASKSELFFTGNVSGFRVVVSKDKLPEDYNE